MKLSDKLSGAIERMSPRKLLLLCGLAAILVFMIIYFILSSVFSSKKEEQPQAAAMVPVIEASRDIEPQTVITEDMVKAVDVSSNLVPTGALTDKNAVVGKKSRYRHSGRGCDYGEEAVPEGRGLCGPHSGRHESGILLRE